MRKILIHLGICLVGIFMGVISPCMLELSLSNIAERNVTDKYAFANYGARFFCIGLLGDSRMRIVQNGSCSFHNPNMTCSGLWGCSEKMCEESFNAMNEDNITYIAYSPRVLENPSTTEKVCHPSWSSANYEKEEYKFMRIMVYVASCIIGLWMFIPLLPFSRKWVVRVFYLCYIISFAIATPITWVFLKKEYDYTPNEKIPIMITEQWRIRALWKMTVYGIFCAVNFLISMFGIIFHVDPFDDSITTTENEPSEYSRLN